MPDYAQFLRKIKKNSIIWFVGRNEGINLFIIPFTTTKKSFFTKGRFLYSTIYLSDKEEIKIEKDFLNKVVDRIKNEKLCDWIEQPPNWAIFKTIPDNSISCPFGTYKINLSSCKSREDLFKNIKKSDKNCISKSIREGVQIKEGIEYVDDALLLITQTALKANISYPSKKQVFDEMSFLNHNMLIYVAYYNNQPQSALICYLNNYSVYCLYTGTRPDAIRGTNNYVFWKAIEDAYEKGVKYFDFVGARINPSIDSKFYRIQKFKESFGTTLETGHLWKMTFSPLKYAAYKIVIKTILFLRKKPFKKDIIDQELQKINNEKNNIDN